MVRWSATSVRCVSSTFSTPGLEFEAVFFVSVDGLTRRIPDLYLRFVYVGMARAATYLGLTCEGRLSSGLEPLRSNFGTTDWSS
ncbi:ATP-binding domain-containing protein [Bradyrhizobium canariense]|uniref:ATP-binding domain-containing protein n=1 Tax=Bradyrhizobium canariense TaxID=255045 RepID=UPI0011778816